MFVNFFPGLNPNASALGVGDDVTYKPGSLWETRKRLYVFDVHKNLCTLPHGAVFMLLNYIRLSDSDFPGEALKILYEDRVFYTHLLDIGNELTLIAGTTQKEEEEEEPQSSSSVDADGSISEK